MGEIQSKLKKVLKETPIEKIEDKLDEYENYLDFLSIIKCARDLQIERKKIAYNYALDNTPFNCRYISSNLDSDKDRKLLINVLLERDEKSVAYDVMSVMNNPKILDEEDIKLILSIRNSLSIYECFGELFIDVILKRNVIDQYDAYKLLEKKDVLSQDTIIKIYEKSFNNISDYLMVLMYLDDKEKKDLTNIFINKKHDNVDIIKRILKDKNYYKEDYNRLILLVGMFGSASVIYGTLMNEQNLSDSQIKMLEKALLDTHSIEYVSYYYFYKRKDLFINMFGSSLLFLSFVNMNKILFKNTNILNNIIKEIKEECEEFNVKITEKYGLAYEKKRKTSRKS